ncbi:hypothetical protein HYQ46_006422 [Verticillium longisporum]|nr:hypothetical protein HYQ46_006422 [Verticillium longisporum]
MAATVSSSDTREKLVDPGREPAKSLSASSISAIRMSEFGSQTWHLPGVVPQKGHISHAGVIITDKNFATLLVKCDIHSAESIWDSEEIVQAADHVWLICLAGIELGEQVIPACIGDPCNLESRWAKPVYGPFDVEGRELRAQYFLEFAQGKLPFSAGDPDQDLLGRLQLALAVCFRDGADNTRVNAYEILRRLRQYFLYLFLCLLSFSSRHHFTLAEI